MDWRDEATIKAVSNYVRLFIGVMIILVLIYHFAANQITISDLITAIGGLLGVDRMVIGALGMVTRNE